MLETYKRTDKQTDNRRVKYKLPGRGNRRTNTATYTSSTNRIGCSASAEAIRRCGNSFIAWIGSYYYTTTGLVILSVFTARRYA